MPQMAPANWIFFLIFFNTLILLMVQYLNFLYV